MSDPCFLADENFPLPSIALLRRAGYDVASVAELAPSADDPDVIRMARESDRILLTFDSDIGTHLYHHDAPPPPGVVYFRFVQGSPTEAAERLLRLLADPKRVLLGRFTTHGRGTTRPRPLPER